MSTPESLEWDAEHQRATDALDGLMTATVDLECAAVGCGLSIHAGDPIQLGSDGWCHVLCAVAESIEAEARHDRDRERGL